jgi:hypothetical protein
MLNILNILNIINIYYLYGTIVNRPDEIQETDIGTGCGLFEVRKIGDE